MALGDKITFSIAPGVRFPGIVDSEVTHSITEAPSRNKPGEMARFPAAHAWVISLRSTNPAKGTVETFYRRSYENLNFSMPRERIVEGLDVIELATGEKFSLDALRELCLDSLDARALARAESGTLTLEELA